MMSAAEQPGAVAERRRMLERLEIAGVSKHFGGVHAVDDVTFSVAPGEAIAVIGPNGAGKSTLLKLISGTHKLTMGSITLGDQRLDNLAAHQVTRSGVALANQVPRPFRRLTVRQNLEVAAQARGRARGANAWVEEVMVTCGIAGLADHDAGSLRLMDRKRLELARALATDPSCILLDEVAAGLVGRELDQIIELVRGIHSEGRTVILVEHVEGVVASLVERAIVLDWGRIICEGKPAEVAADPKVREVYMGSAQPAAVSRGTGHVADARTERAERPPVPLLELDTVSAGYGQLVALRDVNLTVHEGEVVAVMGANGAGKSTMAGAIAGLVKAQSGRMRLGGEDITHEPAHTRSRLGIAMSPEGRRVFAELTVRENLAIAVPLRVPRRELAGRLGQVHAIFPALAELSSQYAGLLSGGQQQMLAIGRALMSAPKLLVCDEISLGLAPVMLDNLYGALAQIRDSGVAVVLIEQNVHRALDFADRAYVLSRGEVTYSGQPQPLSDPEVLDHAYFGAHEVTATTPERTL